jgi:rhomboid protease GluP
MAHQEMHYDDTMGTGPQMPEPEVLPPATQPDPTQQRVRRRSIWASSPATYFLVAVNCLIYLAMVSNHVSPFSPSPEQLIRWGADNAGAVLLDNQWWRIVTAMFVHVGILHLATNMWCLWNLGLLAEPLVGSVGILAVYLLTGAAGNLLSTLVNWIWPIRDASGITFPWGAGASGAVFGIAGALIVLLKSKRLPVPAAELRRLRRSVIYFAAINLVIGFSISLGARFTGINIDNYAHLGGFSCGLLFAAPMVPKLGSPRPDFRLLLGLAVLMIVAILVLFGFYLAKLAG